MTEESRGPAGASEKDDLLPGAGGGRDDAAEPSETGAEVRAGDDRDDREVRSDRDDAPDDRDDDPEPSGAVGLEKGPGVADRLVAGFAPPDSYARDTDIPAPPQPTAVDRPMPSVQGASAPAGPGAPPAGPGEGVQQDVVPDGVVPDGPVPPHQGEQGRMRPGFVPHGYEPHDPRMAAHQQPGQDPRAGGRGTPYGWPPQQSHQPPPAGPQAGPPPGGMPVGGPPGAPRPMTPGGYGGPPGSPNWAPVPPLPSASRGMPGLGVLAVVALIVALVAGGVGAGIGVMASGDGRPADQPSVSLGGDNSGQPKNRPPDSVAGVAQRVLPSVVSIRVAQGGGSGVGGTGFIVNGGYIITNNHVVASGGEIEVVFNDKKRLPATLTGRDAGSDIAVLKPQGQHSLPPLTPGNSDELAVGDPVIAIGSPLGLDSSVTTGIVSALNRAVPTGGENGEISSYLNAIQTDAAINPGNSGGPLVDGKGRVIGINTAILTVGGRGLGGESQSGSIGLGFAIPINQAKRVAESIINTGSVKQARIGVIPDPQFQEGGARIIGSAPQGQEPVTPNGPADKAGLRPGDVITKVDGRPIDGPADLVALIRSKAPGDRIQVTYQRDGRETTVPVTLEAG